MLPTSNNNQNVKQMLSPIRVQVSLTLLSIRPTLCWPTCSTRSWYRYESNSSSSASNVLPLSHPALTLLTTSLPLPHILAPLTVEVCMLFAHHSRDVSTLHISSMLLNSPSVGVYHYHYLLPYCSVFGLATCR